MSKHNIDKDIRDKLLGHESEMDVEAFYARLQKKKRKKAGFWWWIGSGLGLVLLGLTLWSLFLQPLGPSPEDTLLSHTSTVDTMAEGRAEVEASKLNPAPGTDERKMKTEYEAEQRIGGRVSGVEEPSVEKAPLLTSGAQTVQPRGTDAPLPDISKGKSPEHPEKQNLSVTAVPDSMQDDAKAVALIFEEDTLLQTHPLSMEVSWIDPNQLEWKVSPFIDHRWPSLLTATSLNTPVWPLTTPDQPIERRKPWRLGLELSGGVSAVARSMTLQPELAETDWSQYLEAREESETVLEAQHLSLMGRLEHQSGWYVKTGGALTRITERLNDFRQISQVDTMTYLQEIVLSPNGDTSSIQYGLGQFTTTTTYEKQTYNRIDLVEIPLVLGYTFSRKRLALQAEAGVYVNVHLRATGEVLAPGGSDYLSLREGSVFQKRVGVSYYGSLQLRYAFTDNMRLYMGPSVRLFPGSFTADSHPVRQQYQLFGLKAGVVYLW